MLHQIKHKNIVWYVIYYQRVANELVRLQVSVGYYSTQGSGSNTPTTQLIISLYSRKPLLYSLLYSETHYSTQEVAGVTTISS